METFTLQFVLVIGAVKKKYREWSCRGCILIGELRVEMNSIDSSVAMGIA